MASFNRVILMGNLTKDPEVRYTPSGTAVTDIRLAVNRRFRTSDGQDRDETCFVSITVWGRQAETCGEYLGKGSPVLVEGRLKLDEWEKEGQKQSRLGVVAERVQFLGSGRGSGERKGRAAGESRPEPGTDKSSADEAPAPPGDKGDDDNLPF